MLLLPIMMTGCADFNKLKNSVDELTNPLVMVGVYVGIEQPTDPNMNMDGTEFAATAFVTTVLADAAAVGDMADNPVGGAAATLRSDTNGTVDLVEGEAGDYQATSDNGLTYTPGEAVKISVEWDGEHTADIDSPKPAEFSVPQEHEVGEGIVVDLSDQDYDSAFVVVYDLINQEITFDNRPTDIVAIYDWTHGVGTVRVEIPGGAFGSESSYGLGVAGLKHSDSTDFTDTNTLLSTFASGKFTFNGVYTVPMQ